jgi:thiol-disulfide isomerase/thioredoxin
MDRFILTLKRYMDMTHPRTAIRRNPRGAWTALAAVAGLAVLLAGPAPRLAEAQAVDSVLRDFLRTGDYILAVEGKDVPAAEVYLSERVPAYLILSAALPAPTLLTPRAGSVETVPIMKISKRQNGTAADLLADADLKNQGRFQIAQDTGAVHFTVEGKKASLRPRPPLLGLRNAAALRSYSPDYVRGAQAYVTDKAVIAALKKESRPVKVRVFFGSWCGHCKKHLPMLLRVQEELQNPKIQFEYYGLPQGPEFSQDPEVKRLGISGVPTGVVYVNGKEVGRLKNEGWSAPERALREVLASAPQGAKSGAKSGKK